MTDLEHLKAVLDHGQVVYHEVSSWKSDPQDTIICIPVGEEEPWWYFNKDGDLKYVTAT